MTNAAQRVKALIQDMTEDRKRYHALTALLEKQRHHIVALTSRLSRCTNSCRKAASSATRFSAS